MPIFNASGHLFASLKRQVLSKDYNSSIAFSNADGSYLFPSLYMKENTLYNYFIANELEFFKNGRDYE